MSGEQVIQVLDQMVDWYRTLAIQQQGASEPSDVLILYENRQIANQVISLAFAAARADADLLAREPATAQPSADPTVSVRALIQLQVKFAAQGQAIQRELDAQRHRLSTAPKKAQPELRAKMAELQSELDLINTKRSITTSIIAGFGSGEDNSSASALRAQIDAMAIALPGANAAPAAGADARGARPAASTASNPSPAGNAAASPAVPRIGLWALAENVFKLSAKIDTVVSIQGRTTALQAAIAKMHEHVVAQMRALSARGDALASQADTANGAALNGVREQFDVLAIDLKQTSAILIPLDKTVLLLGQCQSNLRKWRDVAENQSRGALKTLGIRLGMVLVILGSLFVLAELWRRATLRYVQDSRRRYQLMLVRRICLWSLAAIIVGFSFAGELGSAVTFAGLLTAGVAVAMQSVLVSIVGYFFLIGKYGIRVGDRVQIGDVNGEVIDLGLVRLYLMEFGGRGSLAPTGRVVAFANSVVFQVTSGLFKQIPGVNFTWHELTLALPAGVDYASTKEKLTAAVIEALKDYQEEIDRQTQEIQRTTNARTGGDALPTVQLKFSPHAVEAHVRYPVHLQYAVETDERVSQAMLQAIADLTPNAAADPSA
ncbi:MAG: mechanosensitive ion channel family protein [Steroidobacteraceae bacterium]